MREASGSFALTCGPTSPFLRSNPRVRSDPTLFEPPALVLCVPWRSGCARAGPVGLPMRFRVRFGVVFRSLFGQFGGRTFVRAKNGRPLRNTAPVQQNRGSGLPRTTPESTGNRFGRCSRTTVRTDCSKKLPRDLLGVFFARSGSSRAVRGRPEVLREGPGSVPQLPGASWERSGSVP